MLVGDNLVGDKGNLNNLCRVTVFFFLADFFERSEKERNFSSVESLVGLESSLVISL